jgi:hypothetical protein
MGESRRTVSGICAEVIQAAVTRCEYCMPDENGVPVLVCRGLKRPPLDQWPMTKKYE